MIRYFFILSVFICSSCANNKKVYKIGFYNVENLFDTIDGPNKDEEYLPESRLNWNQEKYNEKISHIFTISQHYIHAASQLFLQTQLTGTMHYACAKLYY